MTKKELKALMVWRMCSDPWPSDLKDLPLIDTLLDSIARENGCMDWVDAYHSIRDDSPTPEGKTDE